MEANNLVDDGGPAFPMNPIAYHDQKGKTYLAESGMSLRAWLAGQALAGAVASIADGVTWSAEDMAAYCVKRADAVMAALKEAP